MHIMNDKNLTCKHILTSEKKEETKSEYFIKYSNG